MLKRCQDTSDPGHFGTSLIVPKCLGSEVSWVRSVLIPLLCRNVLLCFWATVSALVCLVYSSTVVRNYDDDDDENNKLQINKTNIFRDIIYSLFVYITPAKDYIIDLQSFRTECVSDHGFRYLRAAVTQPVTITSLASR